jgi:enoyl-CoA hydratase/carnithine racemase
VPTIGVIQGPAFVHFETAPTCDKQQAYYLYTSDTIDAQTALRLGMVNEVLPRGRHLPRARAIAARILRMPKLARLMSKQIVRRQLQQRHVQDAGFHLAHELLGFMTNVRRGRRPYPGAGARQPG